MHDFILIGLIYLVWQIFQIGVWIYLGRTMNETINSLKEFKKEGDEKKWLK